MIITKIAVVYGGKLNLGNYESATIELHIEASLDSGDDAAAVEQDLWQRAKESVREQARPLVEARKQSVNAVFAGLPADIKKDLSNE